MAEQIARFIGWTLGQSSYSVSSVDQIIYGTCCLASLMLIFFMFNIISDLVYRITNRR